MKEDFTTSLSLGEKIIYYFVYSIIYAISLLPLRALYVISDGLYVILYKLVSYRKKLVRKNLKDSFPEKSYEELLKIEKKFYHFFCDYIVETVKLTSISKAEMKKRVRYIGMKHIDDSCEAGHSVALYIGHYCNWEWITSIGLHAPHDSKVCQVYHILESKVFNALMLKIRSVNGTQSISMQLILRKLVEKRRDGKKVIIGFISDQVPVSQSTNYFTTFLNHKNTPFITGTEVLVNKFELTSVYLDVSRPRRGYYDINIIPMEVNKEKDGKWAYTEMYARLLEKSIQKNPEYWLWTHNRWKRGVKEFCEWVESGKGASEEQVLLCKRLREEASTK